MNKVHNIQGVELSEETIVNALEKAGVNWKKELKPYETHKIIVGYQKNRDRTKPYPFAIGLKDLGTYGDVEISGVSKIEGDYQARFFDLKQIKNIIEALQKLIKT